MTFSIPNGVERVVLMIRHSAPPSGGTDVNKTLTAEGASLCHEVSEFYTSLVALLSQAMGEVVPTYSCSIFPRSFVTAWEIFHAVNINMEAGLKVWASLLAINNGDWFKAQKAAGLTEPQMIRAFLADPSLMTEAFGSYEYNYTSFIKGQAGSVGVVASKLVVAVCHEAGISLAARDHLPADQLGLDKCEGVLFYVAGGVIVGAEKVVPKHEVPPIV